MSLPLKELIKIGEKQLEDAGIADAQIDAKELYCFMQHIDRTALMMRWQDVLQDNQCEVYFELIARRASREPLQHITGTQEFMGLPFKVSPDVLIPRQDTETMVEDAIEVIKQGTLRNQPYSKQFEKGGEILDLCCGSGAIGISLAKLCPSLKVTCADISKEAIAITEENAKSNGCKIKPVVSDIFDEIKGKFGSKKFDLIISNPPYIETEVIKTLEPEVRDHEPVMALDGGEDGLKFYRRIIIEAALHLKTEGMLMFEIGYNQAEKVTNLLEETQKYENILSLKDLTGKDRIIVATLCKKDEKNKK